MRSWTLWSPVPGRVQMQCLVDSLAGESYRYRQQNLGTHVNNMGATGLNANFYVRDKAIWLCTAEGLELAACNTLGRTSPPDL